MVHIQENPVKTFKMPFMKKIKKEYKRAEGTFRRERDRIFHNNDKQEHHSVSEPVSDSVVFNPPNAHDDTSLANDNSISSLQASPITLNVNKSGESQSIIQSPFEYPVKKETETQKSYESDNLNFDDVFENIEEWEDCLITKQADEYKQGVDTIKLDLKNEIPLDDKPLPFPKPDFSPLEPIKDLIDVDDDYEIIEPFLDDEDEDMKEKTTPQEPPEIIVWESSRQEEDTTDEYYSNNSAKRGLALVFINYDLSSTKSEIRQMEEKVNSLKTLLAGKLEFQVETDEMNSKDHIVNILKNVNNREEANGDCLLVVILTRGFRDMNGREFLYCGQDLVEPIELWTLLDGSSCIILANKPKIFLQLGWNIKKQQKGLKEDSATLLISSKGQNQPETGALRIPNMTHFFIISAIEQGNWNIEREMVDNFIENFVSVMESYGHIWDLAKIMTEVQYRVAWSSLSLNADVQGKHRRTRASTNLRAPNVISSLIRKILFKPKS